MGPPRAADNGVSLSSYQILNRAHRNNITRQHIGSNYTSECDNSLVRDFINKNILNDCLRLIRDVHRQLARRLHQKQRSRRQLIGCRINCWLIDGYRDVGFSIVGCTYISFTDCNDRGRQSDVSTSSATTTPTVAIASATNMHRSRR